MTAEDLDLVVGYAEASEATGLTVNHLRVLNTRGQLPPQIGKRVWQRATLQAWMDERGHHGTDHHEDTPKPAERRTTPQT